MAKDRFMIGYTDNNTGLQTNVLPWLLPDNAFSKLENAYVFRGKVRKRFGSTLMGDTHLNSRLRIQVGDTTAPAATPDNIAIGQMFSVADEIYTVYQTGAMLASTAGTSGTATVGTTVFAIASVAPAGTKIYWYPSLPVMGITQYEEQDINQEKSVAFDTRFAYYFDIVNNGWEQLGLSTWTGNNAQFFWCVNYYGSTANSNDLWVTNYHDTIAYWNGVGWTSPVITTATTVGTSIVQTARIIIPFKHRLVLLNTKETVNGAPNVTFNNRCRYSATGSPTGVDSWNVSIPGEGGFVDPSTAEAIVTAQLLKDRLIVYFERSTWELVYTGNQLQPFVWQKINTELGAESTFSQVPFDKVVLGIGNTGIHACTGTNVERIDNTIPNLVLSFHNQNQGVDRIAGIRDYDTEMVYWTFPTDTRTATTPFPDKVLAYNYKNSSWGVNDDSFTAFGYYQLSEDTPGLTWGSSLIWGETELRWGGIHSGYIGRTRKIIAGNQQGWVVIINPDVSRNSESLYVTNNSGYSYTIIDHNLKANEYVRVHLDGAGISNAKVNSVVDKDTVTLSVDLASYNGNASISRVSKIDIQTKEYNFYADKNRNAYISQISFMVDKIVAGKITIDYYISSADGLSMMEQAEATGTLLGSTTLDLDKYELAPMEEFQERVWHSMYTQAEGECIQLRIYYSDDQLYLDEARLPFTLHAMIFQAQPTALQLQS